MGYPMAGYLANKNHEVVVYNRTASKADAWCAEYHGTAAATPAAAAQSADIVFVCVGNDDDVRQVVLGDDVEAVVFLKPRHTERRIKTA